ncbi:MIME protein, partial [Atractosteus spatula]|nr:MIME protein [Atractosteus spatula]
MSKLKPLLFSLILVLWVVLAAVTAITLDSEHRNNEKDIFRTPDDFLTALEAKKQETIIDYEDLTPADTEPAENEVPVLPTPKEAAELPTCLLCVCLSGSVYCEEVVPVITAVPALPKETAYLYARYNKIAKIAQKDFSEIPTLRRIDLTGNAISEIEEGAFSKLPQLEELSLAENRLVKLPTLPTKLTLFNANHNRLRTRGVKANAFRKLVNLSYLYLANNELEAVPPHLPESLRVLHLQNNNITAITDETFCKGNNTRYIRTNMDEIRLEGNPIILGKYPNSFTCLKSLPMGSYF